MQIVHFWQFTKYQLSRERRLFDTGDLVKKMVQGGFIYYFSFGTESNGRDGHNFLFLERVPANIIRELLK
jgi:hypothetical protein